MNSFSAKGAAPAVILMGVSGCGKTSIGSRLAEKLGWPFIESDDYHSAEDIRKMSNGIPLTDADRQPWLERLHCLLVDFSRNNKPVVMACSALKENYRQILNKDLENIIYIYLKGDFEIIRKRMQNRRHFMKAEMLASQFEILEEPHNALVMDVTHSPEYIVKKVLSHLQMP